jgi:hypothetical protein
MVPWNPRIFLPLIALLAGHALADPVDSKLPFYCDQRTGAFFISRNHDITSSRWDGKMKQAVNWIALLKTGPQKNGWGDPLRTGSRTRTEQCGPITVKFSSGFLNANPQGELGAMDFPVVEIRQGKHVLLKPTALEQCEVNSSRYTYFGACPDNWAEHIEAAPEGKGFRITVKRAFADTEYKDVERIDEVRPSRRPAQVDAMHE